MLSCAFYRTYSTVSTLTAKMRNERLKKLNCSGYLGAQTQEDFVLFAPDEVPKKSKITGAREGTQQWKGLRALCRVFARGA